MFIYAYMFHFFVSSLNVTISNSYFLFQEKLSSIINLAMVSTEIIYPFPWFFDYFNS